MQKKLIYPETLYKTKSPKKNFWQHDTLGENFEGWGGGGGGGGGWGCLCHIPPHHYPTPDTQT